MEAVLQADGALVAAVADLPSDGALVAAVADTVADLPADGALVAAVADTVADLPADGALAAAVLRVDGAHKAEMAYLPVDGVPVEPEAHPAMRKAAGSEPSTS